MLAFDIEGYGIVLKVFSGYRLWEKNQDPELSLNQICKSEIMAYETIVEKRDETINLLRDDRDHAYQLFKDEQERNSKIKTKATVKLILFSAGTGIVGAAIGLLIGVFAI
jgi:hypothetical protein